MNLQEDFCSSEIVKLLKEKGFKCGATYSKGFVKDRDGFVGGLVRHEDKITHQLAMKWLREKWIFIEISFSVTTNGEPCYNFGILSRSAQWVYRHKQSFSTYEEAVEAALKHVLENLI